MRILGVLVIVALVILGVGLWQGWFSFDSDDANASDRTDVTFSINKDEIKKDVGKVKDAAEDLVGKDRQGTSIEGVVTAVDSEKQLLTVSGEGDVVLTMRTPSETQIVKTPQRNSLADIRVGDHVVVTYYKKDNQLVADKVTMLEGKGG